MIRRDPRALSHSITPASPGAEAHASRTVAVLIVDAASRAPLDALLDVVFECDGWSAQRGAIIVWQVAPVVAADASAPEGNAPESRAPESREPESGVARRRASVGAAARGLRDLGELRDLGDGASLEPGGLYFVAAPRALRFDGRAVRLEAGGGSAGGAIDRLLLSLAESWGERAVCVLAHSGADERGVGARIVRGVGGLVVRLPPARPKPLPRALAREGGATEPPPAAAPPALGDAAAVAPAAGGVAAVAGSAAERPTMLSDGRAPTRAAAAAPRSAGAPSPIATGASAPRTARVFVIPSHRLEAAKAACRAALERGLERGVVRVWMPECKAGGLTYAMAMLLADATRHLAAPPRVTIFGTDPDEGALAIARPGRYPARAALGMDPALRAAYTFDDGDTIRVSEALRERCVFSRRELLHHPPVARVDLLICHRIFDAAPQAYHAPIIDSFHFALREGGVLFALDHVDRFPEELFEPVAEGFLRARQVVGGWAYRKYAVSPLRRAKAPRVGAPLAAAASPASAQPTQTPRSPLAHPRERSERVRGSPVVPVASAPAPPEVQYPEIGLPVIVCDAELRVSFISQAALGEFKLLPSEQGAALGALTGRLPGGAELMQAARRALVELRTEELSVRGRGRAYLVRVSAAPRSGALTIAYVDVTPIEAARARAVAEQHRQAALARISELGAGLATSGPLYEEALAALFSNVPACSAGAIAELAGGPQRYEVVASRGLGADPLRTLRGMGDAVPLLDQAVARECVVSQHGARVPLDASTLAGKPRSARARQALSTLTTGLACPVFGDGLVIGVIVLLGRQASIDNGEHRAFATAVAGVLGASIVRHRARRGLALELGVRRQLGAEIAPSRVGEGLERVFQSTLQAELVELWSSRDDAHTRWQRLHPAAGDPREGGAGLVMTVGSGAVLHSFENERAEVWIPIEVHGAPRYLLRLRGATLRIIDVELAHSLKRIGATIGALFERAELRSRA